MCFTLVVLWIIVFQFRIISLLYVFNTLPHCYPGIKPFEAQKSCTKVFHLLNIEDFVCLVFLAKFCHTNSPSSQRRRKEFNISKSCQMQNWFAQKHVINNYTAVHSQKAMRSTWKAWVVHIYIVTDWNCNSTASIIGMMEVPVLKIYVPNRAASNWEIISEMCKARWQLLWRYGKP